MQQGAGGDVEVARGTKGGQLRDNGEKVPVRNERLQGEALGRSEAGLWLPGCVGRLAL